MGVAGLLRPLGTAAVVSHPPAPKHTPRPYHINFEELLLWVGGRNKRIASPNKPSPQFSSKTPSLTTQASFHLEIIHEIIRKGKGYRFQIKRKRSEKVPEEN